MQLIDEKIMDYVLKYSSPEPEILQELRRETWQKVLAPRMLSGPSQGRLLALLSKIIQPKNILEIGTYTGYSTLCLAEGLSENGHIYTIDKNDELVKIQEKYFQKSSLTQKIIRYSGDALEIIPQLKLKYDLIYLDADKKNYPKYFDLILDLLNPGGILLSDNVLWDGKVTNEIAKNDLDTQQIHTFNKRISLHKDFETIILPFRDGISISRKK